MQGTGGRREKEFLLVILSKSHLKLTLSRQAVAACGRPACPEPLPCSGELGGDPAHHCRLPGVLGEQGGAQRGAHLLGNFLPFFKVKSI